MDERLFRTFLLATYLLTAIGDSYLNNPRGSNNKLREQSNNVQNANRLFDSQNNGASGYQIGDNCKPACKDNNNNYDVTKPGATKGTMTYYQGSELYVEWYHQHGCGVAQPNLHCQIILQYMCEGDQPNLRDGTGQGRAGGDNTNPTDVETADVARGLHESLAYYRQCAQRERNKGLYTADQQMNDNAGATATRQNANGNQNNDRHGLECPEERDYYPYWHPSPWHDIAIMTSEPQERCAYYQKESQNVQSKGFCSNPAFNNPDSCQANGGSWQTQSAFNEPTPDCTGGISSRDNHNGNVRNGNPVYYLWKIPSYVQGRCVMRLRYNISTMDFDLGSLANPVVVGQELQGIKADPFFMDSSYNDPNPGNRRRSIFRGRPKSALPLGQDPVADWLALGNSSGDLSRVIQLQVNTNQYGRTFQDRTHSFFVKPRPSDIPNSARIVNYNVKGRRGNIVQVYPSVEYDFVPADLVVAQGDYLHFQWTGSDANDNNNAGNGRAGTDRSNLVQVESRGETVPLPLSKHTLLADMTKDPSNPDGRRLVDKFAFLNQDQIVNCDPNSNNNNAADNCKQLNGASAYFDSGLVQMQHVGVHYVASTRNNDFSNRSQKATITVVAKSLTGYAIFGIVIGSLFGCGVLGYFAAACYAWRYPGSWVFSRRYRPRIISWVVKKEQLDQKVEERRQLVAAMRRNWAKQAGLVSGDEEEAGENGKAVVLQDEKMGWAASSVRNCRKFGVGEQRLTNIMYAFLNLAVFLIGFLQNLDGGFHESIAFPLAKGGGYVMDMNFAMIVLPTLKSLQTAIRRVGSSREWIPIDDPIAFHITVACYIILGITVHVIGHFWHLSLIRNAEYLQSDPLQLWNLTPEETVAGTSWVTLTFNLQNRCAVFTGYILCAMMALMCLTAMPCSRRGTNRLTKWLGGYNLFARVHSCWPWVYVILMIHAPARLWIWFFFPVILIAVDRMLLASHQSIYLSLKQVKVLPRDVMALTFELPKNFSYQAGQYLLLGWKGEWHPFTLTSAPEERILSVHIRAPRDYDWCSALRRRLTEEAPSDAGDMEKKKGVKTGTVIEYQQFTLANSSIVYNRPVVIRDIPKVPHEKSPLVDQMPPPDVDEVPKLLGRTISGQLPPVLERKHSGETNITTVNAQDLPSDAVVLQATGPFGAPAQKVWGFETIMIVGAGIGVTPFASILRSVQMKAQQRETILHAASSTSKFDGQVHFQGITEAPSSPDVQGLVKLVEEMVTIPKRIYFYWIVRGQEEFDWFYDLLVTAAEGPAASVVDITLFLTGEIELSQVKKLPCASGQFFGRPNWARIFKQNREKHKGEHVGVFLCGSPMMGNELARQSIKHSDLPGTPKETRFSFFKEHF